MADSGPIGVAALVIAVAWWRVDRFVRRHPAHRIERLAPEDVTPGDVLDEFTNRPGGAMMALRQHGFEIIRVRIPAAKAGGGAQRAEGDPE